MLSRAKCLGGVLARVSSAVLTVRGAAGRSTLPWRWASVGSCPHVARMAVASDVPDDHSTDSREVSGAELANILECGLSMRYSCSVSTRTGFGTGTRVSCRGRMKRDVEEGRGGHLSTQAVEQVEGSRMDTAPPRRIMYMRRRDIMVELLPGAGGGGV